MATQYFTKILIANRGEIAVRIMRTCRELGIKTVAVYSEIDRSSLHVQYADEAYNIGGNSARDSYLRIDKLIQIALKAKVQAIHPGYGFLAENPSFCKACQKAGIIFIGPDINAIETMGNKTAARRLMKKSGIPMIPGTIEPVVQDPSKSMEIAENIGFPIMIKAAAGGGGKGMRIVTKKEDFKGALRAARSEASSSFNDDNVYFEKYITNPHHIEIQILADNFGNTVHLFERECSIQRRHQKVIEESPSPFIDEELRQKMGKTAVEVAKAVQYRNAGTVEFIVDDQKNYYFLEMNTRLQVEHPVTELVTGKDLVRLQLSIAAGEVLPFQQEDLTMRGAAIECRIYAEDPNHNFIPSPGKIVHLNIPAGPGIRDDSGVYEGFNIPVFYDPIISKLCTWAENRHEALTRMSRALSEYKLTGVKTNISLHQQIVKHPIFQKGKYDTSFIEKYFSPQTDRIDSDEKNVAIAVAAILHYLEHSKGAAHLKNNSTAKNNWKEFGRRKALGNI